MAGFEIDGRDYPIPSVFELTMGEAQVLYDYSGNVVEDWVPPLPGEPDNRVTLLRNPAFKRAMVHIAYQRGNPELSREEVAKLVDGVDNFDMTAAMYEVAKTENPTPADQTSWSGNNENTASAPGSSGRHSMNGSDEPAMTLLRTGTTE